MSQIFTHFLLYYYCFIFICCLFHLLPTYFGRQHTQSWSGLLFPECFLLILLREEWLILWTCLAFPFISPLQTSLWSPASFSFHWLVLVLHYGTELPFRNDILWIFTSPTLMKHSSFKPFYYSCSILPNKCLRIIFPNIADSQTTWGLGRPPQCSQNPSVTLQSALCIQVLHLWLQPNVDCVHIYWKNSWE